MATRSYEEAIACLNSLQSNAAEIAAAAALPVAQRPSKKLDLVREYLARMGYSPDQLNSLNVIHVTGTKGKGSTCALADSILRATNPNWQIGLYTSPHLIAVRERIRLNGLPLSEDLFAKYFFEVWDKLGSCGRDPTPELPIRPMYFRFLTIMAFHVFMSLKVDATILEVGIGGLLDDTNVVPRPVVTGVSSIGYDHMNVLGYSLREIATQKGGIFKEGVPAFTVPQPPEALEALKVQAHERKASDLVIVPLSDEVRRADVGIPGAHQKENATLAVRMVEKFLSEKQPTSWSSTDGNLPTSILEGLRAAKWPGRCQKLVDPIDTSLTWFLDGAHTEESLKCCLEWYVSPEAGLLNKNNLKSIERILLFNCTKGRSTAVFLQAIAGTIRQQLEKYGMQEKLPAHLFSRVIFCTNATYADGGFKKDLLSVNLSSEGPNLTVQNELANAWMTLFPSFCKDRIHQLPSIEHAVRIIKSQSTQTEKQVLVTGSLHLVGGTIEAAALADVAF